MKQRILAIVLIAVLLMSITDLSSVQAEQGGLPELSCGESEIISLANGEHVEFEFTPEESGEYVVYMPLIRAETEDPNENFLSCFLFCVDYQMKRIDSPLDVWQNGRYMMNTFMAEAGKTYTITARNDDSIPSVITSSFYLHKMERPEKPVIETEEDNFFVGHSVSFTCRPDSEIPVVTQAITWSSSDESVLMLEFEGLSMAHFEVVSVGTATVTATLENGESASYQVTTEEFVFKEYQITEGAGAKITAGEGLALQIACKFDKFSDFDGAVKVYDFFDGYAIDRQWYTVEEANAGESTVVTIKPEGLKTLKPGVYYITVMFVDGDAFTDFEVRGQTVVSGDVTGDGNLNNRDVTRLLQYLAGWDVEIQESALDVTGDGKVNNRDVTRLLQYLAGWDVELVGAAS